MSQDDAHAPRHGSRPGHVLDEFFRTAPSPDLGSIRDVLWNEPPGTGDGPQAVSPALLEQYRMYVEMADRISARRAVANTFFLTLNTAIFSFGRTIWDTSTGTPPVVLGVIWAILLLQCLAWFWLLRSYRQLNSAKYAVVGALEERMPSSPYWRAEWAALGEGRDRTRYWPLSHVEQWMPTLFGVGYSIAFLTSIL